MKKPKLLIIVLFQNLENEPDYFALSPAPPLSGALLAGLTPPIVDIELHHEMIRPIDYDTDANFIALSFMDYCAPHAYNVAQKFKDKGKVVVAGGKYASTFPEKVIPYMDATIIGEAELIWPRVVRDLVEGKLQKVYKAPFAPVLDNIPPPRYDLIEKQFMVPLVTEATRGCIYRCRYCQLTINPQPYRRRPVPDVINDLRSTKELPFYKRKMAMLLDNNLGGDMAYAKLLLKEIAKLKLWGLGVQFSFDCLQDDEFIELLVKANCIMAFIGLESLNEPSLSLMHKKQNKVQEYRELFMKLKCNGILTFTGLMLAMDADTPEYYRQLPQKLNEIDPSSILLSISIPIVGTPFYYEVLAENRITDNDLAHYEGDHLVFSPKLITEEEVIDTFKKLNRYFYSWKNIIQRWLRLMVAMSTKKFILFQLPRLLILSIVLIKLSIFQRDHAAHKVYKILNKKNTLKFQSALQ